MINAQGGEVSDVVGFLNNLSASVENEISSRGDSISAEESARESADATLQANIDAEVSECQGICC